MLRTDGCSAATRVNNSAMEDAKSIEIEQCSDVSAAITNKSVRNWPISTSPPYCASTFLVAETTHAHEQCRSATVEATQRLR